MKNLLEYIVIEVKKHFKLYRSCIATAVMFIIHILAENANRVTRMFCAQVSKKLHEKMWKSSSLV